MFDQRHSSKIKNEKILRWRLELACFKFNIVYRPGSANAPADVLSRVSVSMGSEVGLKALHVALCQPGVSRMSHWVRAKNLPFSVEDVRRVINSCTVCAEVKPRFHRHVGALIKATSPFERLSLAFKGPLSTKSRNQYLHDRLQPQNWRGWMRPQSRDGDPRTSGRRPSGPPDGSRSDPGTIVTCYEPYRRTAPYSLQASSS